MDIFSFIADGSKIEGHGAVFPIFDQNAGGEIIYLGTGFFISHNGIFVTAKHVIIDAHQPFMVHTLIGKKRYIRAISTADLSHRGDITVGTLVEIKDALGNILANDRLILSSYIPKPTDAVSTYAYPETAVDFDDDKKRYIINAVSRQYAGVAVKVHMDGIKRISPSPILLCTIDSLPGNSGGPVFSVNANGVIGINSSGMKGEYHIVSLIDELRTLKIDNIKLPGSEEMYTMTIEQLIKIGAVVFRH